MATVEHESQIRSADGLAILTGLWLMIAPAVIGFGSTGMKWSSVITGLVIAVLGVTQEATLRGTWENWVTMAAGVWAIIAPFVFSGTTNAAAWASVVGGVLAIGFAAWSASIMAMEGQMRHV
jgi:VIT1/CCC1 family predicted Fe2+/Mn2+ transporter